MERVAALQRKFGAWGIVLSRPVPVLAEASVIAAGFTGMPFAKFAALSALSNLGISAAYAYTGATAADRESFLLAFAGAIAAGKAIAGQRVGIVISGGNVDLSRYAALLAPQS